MWELFKQWLLRDELIAFNNAKARYRHERELLAQRRQNLDITTLVREKLHGFDPTALEGDYQDIMETIPEEEEADFLSQFHDLEKNDALKRLFTFLKREQIFHAVKAAPSMESVNYNRATLNGIAVVEEEIGRLHALYLERHAKEEEYDKNEVI